MEQEKMEVREIALESIVVSPRNPRRSFGKEKLAELAASIKAEGVRQPILVRPLGVERRASKGAGEFEIVYGERRWRACAVAGLKSVPCVVEEMDEGRALELAVVENSQREDVHPLEESAGYGMSGLAATVRFGGRPEQARELEREGSLGTEYQVEHR